MEICKPRFSVGLQICYPCFRGNLLSVFFSVLWNMAVSLLFPRLIIGYESICYKTQTR